MTNDPRGNDEAIRGLRRLGHAVVPVEDPERIDARREKLLPALSAFADSVFEAKERRSVRRRTVVGAGVAVALSAAAAFVVAPRARHSSAPTPSMLSATGAVLVGRPGAEGVAGVAPRALGADDHVRTEGGHAEIGLPGGATVTVDPMSELSLANDHSPATEDDRVVLGAGTIHVSVPKVASGKRLVVATPNAVVTGTVFVVQVSAARGGMQTTQVSVTDGRVTVSSGGREIVLDAGASWSSGPAAAPEAVPSAVSLDALPRAEASARAPRGSSAVSTLSAENELFRQALLARKAGNPARALVLLDQLLAKYPGSPLAAEARTERQNAALDADRARGVGSRP